MSVVDDFNPMKILVHNEKINQLIDFHKKQTNHIPYPVMLEIDLSNVCNFRCSFCQCGANLDKSHLKHFIDEEDWFYNLLPFIIKNKIKGLFFCGGGEPLLNKGANKIISSLIDLNIKSAITSNGSHIDSLDSEVCANTCEWITFSVNAGDENTFMMTSNPLDVKLTWESYINNLRSFVEGVRKYRKNVSPELSYKFVVTPENYASLKAGYNLAVDMEFDQFIIKPADLIWSRDGFKKDWDLETRLEINKIILDLNNENKIKVKSLEAYWQQDDMSKKERGYDICWTQSLAPVLHPDGNMSICCDMREIYNIGKWDNPSLQNFWGSWSHIKAVRGFNKRGLGGCPIRCKMGRYNKVVNDIFIDKKVHTCFL